jgi:hypothetical protein
MSTSIVNPFAKPSSRLVLTVATLVAGVAAAAQPQSDPQSLAQQLLSPPHAAASAHAATSGSASLPDAHEQARRLLLGTAGRVDPSGVRADRSLGSRERRSSPRVEGQDLARSMILGHEA